MFQVGDFVIEKWLKRLTGLGQVTSIHVQVKEYVYTIHYQKNNSLKKQTNVRANEIRLATTGEINDIHNIWKGLAKRDHHVVVTDTFNF